MTALFIVGYVLVGLLTARITFVRAWHTELDKRRSSAYYHEPRESVLTGGLISGLFWPITTVIWLGYHGATKFLAAPTKRERIAASEKAYREALAVVEDYNRQKEESPLKVTGPGAPTPPLRTTPPNPPAGAWAPPAHVRSWLQDPAQNPDGWQRERDPKETAR